MTVIHLEKHFSPINHDSPLMPQTNRTGQPVAPEAFRDLVMAELDAVYRFALHLSRDALQAEDLVQETYLHALRSAHTFRAGRDTTRPWLFKILHNIYRARRRRSGIESRILAEIEMQSTATSDWSDPALSDGEPIDWELVDDQLKDAIHGLPDDLRATFLLFASEDLKYRQIADVLDIPIGTVMSRLSRARKQLIGSLKTEPCEGNKVPVLRIVDRDENGRQEP